jgi:hypothetical protein
MKNTMNHRNSAALTALLLGSAVLAGCGYQHGENFYADDAVRGTGQIAQAQCAAGAKDDAMLYDMNFHGDKLNSLGEGKLDLILKGTSAGDPVFVYLNMPHDQVAERQVAVTAYLKTAGISESKIVVAEGPNLGNTTPTAANLQHVYRKDGEIYNGEYAKDDALAAGAGAGGVGGAGGAGH